MLLPDNIHPQYSIYYNGAIVLKALQDSNESDILDLYLTVKNENNMSYSIFVLCLDWLYLINAAELNNGKVELCF
jgi:hypothetical protein